MQFSTSGMITREELLEVPKDEEMLHVSVLSEGDFSAVDNLDVAMADIVNEEKSEWKLEKEQYKITLVITPVDKAPSDWFDRGISMLSSGDKPWYFTAEDLYKCTKDMMQRISEKISSHSPIPSEYLNELSQKLDFVTNKVAEKLLVVQLEEGFSFVAKIDELLEKLLGDTDEQIDAYRLKLALKLQELRKKMTLHLNELSKSLAEKKEHYRSQAEEAYSKNKDALEKTVATAYTWASDKSAETSNWFAQAENEAIVNKIDALRLSGKDLLEQTRTRAKEARDQVVGSALGTRDKVVNSVMETRDQLVDKMTDTRDQVVNSVQDKWSAADEALRVQLPAVAHPYVVQAVSKSQPYVESAVNTASPYVQSVRDQAAIKKLEGWVTDKKKDELMELLEKNKDTRAGSIVSALLDQASQVITEVSDYCLNEDYFSRNKEESDPATEAVGDEGIQATNE